MRKNLKTPTEESAADLGRGFHWGKIHPFFVTSNRNISVINTLG
jgi:hypothetical protein